jgi:hypothetical protein
MLAGAMRTSADGRAALLSLAVTAGVALGIGTAVYLLDRPAGSAWLIPAAWQSATPGRWFGPFGPWLPSLAHAFAFSVLTALALPRRPGYAAAACVAWAVVDTLAEIGQHPAFAGALAAALAAAFDGAAAAVRLGRYFTMGSFDAADLAAGWTGSALAFVALRRWLPAPPAPAAPAAPAAGPAPTPHPPTPSSPHRGS